tara:strand:- start:144 stop:476 length:333 start_codon:yes stop_codon:yes gene_type:complete
MVTSRNPRQVRGSWKTNRGKEIMSNPFRNELMRNMYDSCTDSARREIWILPNGSQKRGSGHSAAFWDGYNNRPTVCHNPADPAFRTTLGYAAYRAGQDWKKTKIREEERL